MVELLGPFFHPFLHNSSIFSIFFAFSRSYPLVLSGSVFFLFSILVAFSVLLGRLRVHLFKKVEGKKKVVAVVNF